ESIGSRLSPTVNTSKNGRSCLVDSAYNHAPKTACGPIQSIPVTSLESAHATLIMPVAGGTSFLPERVCLGEFDFVACADAIPAPTAKPKPAALIRKVRRSIPMFTPSIRIFRVVIRCGGRRWDRRQRRDGRECSRPGARQALE